MTPSPQNELRLRLVSAAVGLPLLLAVVWAGGAPFVIVAAAAALLAVRELLGLLRAARVRRGSGGPDSGLRGRGGGLRDWALAAVGVCYVALPFAALGLTRLGDAGLQWVALAFLATFATDTGAYAVGRAIGRRKLAPSVSPGKTWEGAIGGLLGAAGATVALVHLLDGVESRVCPALALGIAIGVAAQAGDLLESKLKRMAGAKDSGRLIPGHGGLLDRLDSLVPVFPLVYYASRVW